MQARNAQEAKWRDMMSEEAYRALRGWRYQDRVRRNAGRTNRNTPAEAGLRALRQWEQARRNQAARVIQKHWRGGLVNVPNVGKVHQSRVVRHEGKVYNARRLFASWPGTMNDATMARVVQRGRSWPTRIQQHRVEHLVSKMRSAVNARRRGKFEPYRAAGWRLKTFVVLRKKRTGPILKYVTAPVQTRWSERSLRAAMSGFLNMRVLNVWTAHEPYELVVG